MRLQRNRRTLTLLAVPVVCLTVISVTATALTPALLAHHPLLLIVLSARNRNLVATAAFVSVIPFFTAAIVGRFVADPFLYLLGRLYGVAAVRWVEQRSGGGRVVVRALERWFRRASWPFVFLFPGGLVCVLAGATGMAPRTFILLDLAGTLTVITVLRIVGHEIAGPVEVVRNFLGHNLLWTTALTISLTLLWVLRQRRKGTSEIESISSIVAELEGRDPPR